MRERVFRLERLLGIRRVVEGLDRRDLELATAAVSEVEKALRSQELSGAEAGVAARAALAEGKRGEWLMADAQCEVAGWNRGRLGILLRERAAAVPPARERFLESHREQEQVKVLVEDAKRKERSEEDRRAQVASDDWFLGRLVRAGGRVLDRG